MSPTRTIKARKRAVAVEIDDTVCPHTLKYEHGRRIAQSGCSICRISSGVPRHKIDEPTPQEVAPSRVPAPTWRGHKRTPRTEWEPRVRELHAQGATTIEIAAAMQTPHNTTYERIKALDLVPHKRRTAAAA
jgi:hypothetical protein